MPKTQHWQWYVEEFAPTELHHHAVDRVYYAGRSQFQQIAVIETPAFGKMLILDGDTQSSQHDEKIYTNPWCIRAGGRERPLRDLDSRRRRGRNAARNLAPSRREALHDGGYRRRGGRTLEDLLARVVGRRVREPRARVIVGDALRFLKEDGGRYGVVVSDLTEPLADSPSTRCFATRSFATSKRG